MRPFHNSILVIFCSLFLNSCSENNDFENTKVSKNESDVQTNSDNSDNNDTGTESAGFIISAISGVTDETGTTATFTIKLKTQPLANVSISVSSSDATEGSVNPSSLIFSSSNWNNEQTVTVTGVDDTALDGNQSFTVLLGSASSSDSNYSGLDPNDVTVTNNDDDTAGYTVSKTTDNTSEDGSAFTFTVKLNSQPSSDVTISLSTTDTSEGAVSPSSLTFSSSNWSTLQTVAVNGIDDDAVDGNQSYTVTIGAGSSSDSNYNGLNPDDVTVVNLDDDVAGFTLNPSSGTTSENGGTTEFNLKLNSQPSANVTISVTSSNTSEATVSASNLTFTNSNWSTAQTITITGVDDSISDGNASYTVTLGAASSTDSNYNNLNPSDFTGSNTDDDSPGYTISGGTDNTTEIGGTSKFSLKLNSQPTADVSVSLTSTDTTEGTVSPSSLTFTNSNWNTAQTVTATGVDDTADDGNISYSITTGAASSSDSNYSGLNPNDITISNLNDEWGGVKQYGASGREDIGIKISQLTSGYGYVGGHTFGNFDGNSNPIISASDSYVLKYSLDGSINWIKQFGLDNQREDTGGIVTDSNGNVYVTGYAELGLNGESANLFDYYLYKLDANGDLLWTVLHGTNDYEESEDITIDSSGNLYIVGLTQGNLDGSNHGSSSSPNDIFVTKFNSSGTRIWTKQYGTTGNDYGYVIAIDSGNNIIIGAIVGNSFGSNTYNGQNDGLLIKLDPSGNILWSNQFGSGQSETIDTVIVNSSDEILVAGGLDSGTSADEVNLYNSSGSLQWTIKHDGDIHGIAIDQSNNLYICLTDSGNVNGVTNTGGRDIFFSKYDSNQNRLWTKSFGTNVSEYCNDIKVKSNYFYITGFTRYGNTGAGVHDNDIILLKYDLDGNLQ